MVAARRPSAREIEHGLAGALGAGIEGASLLRRHFPDFAAAQGVDARPATLEALAGCCAAFWHLVDTQAGMPLLRWPEEEGSELDPEQTPEETLGMFREIIGVEWMAYEFGRHIAEPIPHYWGFGVESLMDEWRGEVSEVLAIALWHLFDHTPWSIGVELGAVIDERIDLETVTRLRPLPGDARIERIAIDIPEAAIYDVPPGELLRYPFARCENDLANHTDYEYDNVHFGEYAGGPMGLAAWDWDELPALIARGREARRLEQAWEAWAKRVARNPSRELPMLAADLRAAAREAGQDTGATLAELLGATTEPSPIGTDTVPEELLV